MTLYEAVISMRTSHAFHLSSAVTDFSFHCWLLLHDITSLHFQMHFTTPLDFRVCSVCSHAISSLKRDLVDHFDDVSLASSNMDFRKSKTAFLWSFMQLWKPFLSISSFETYPDVMKCAPSFSILQYKLEALVTVTSRRIWCCCSCWKTL